jgi:polyhydroxyalkanoate synthesis regulator phasin
VHAIIKQMVASGEITPERIDESYQRILKLKGKLKNRDVATYESEIMRLQNEVTALNAKLNSMEVNSEGVKETRKSKRKKKS